MRNFCLADRTVRILHEPHLSALLMDLVLAVKFQVVIALLDDPETNLARLTLNKAIFPNFIIFCFEFEFHFSDLGRFIPSSYSASRYHHRLGRFTFDS